MPKDNDTLEATLYSPSADRGWEKLEISQYTQDQPEYIQEEDSADVYTAILGDSLAVSNPFEQDIGGGEFARLDTLPYDV